MQSKFRPPKAAVWLLSKMSEYESTFLFSGDLCENYERIVQESGLAKAKLWYWSQVIFSIIPYLKFKINWSFIMFKSYIKIALRNMKRHKIYSVISISGLAIGMTCCIITALFVNRELSFDRFHKNAERIYQLYFNKVSSENRRNYAIVGNLTPQKIAEELPELETYVNILWLKQATSVEDKQFLVDGLYAGAEFFDIFSFPLLAGDPKTVLKDPCSVVITPDLAQKYFGDNNPIGQTITMERDEQDLKVTGIMQKMPSNSHIKSDFVLSFNSLAEENKSLGNVYLLFNSKINREDIEGKINALLAKNSERKRDYFLQPMTSVYLDADMALDIATHSDIKYSILLSLLSFMIITISCVNFLNLAGARTLARLKEICIRKITGARNIELIKLFFTESLLFSSISGVLALIITQIFLQQYNSSSFSSRYPLHIDFTGSLTIYLIMFVIIIVVGFIAGYYPAFLAWHVSAWRKE